MIAYYERYQAGEHVAVWSELIALGKKVRKEPVLAEALKVCTEIVRRARANLRMLHTRLLDLGYLFAEADVALVDVGPDAPAKLEAIGKDLGVLPLIAHVWYGTLESVNFSQADEQRICEQDTRMANGPDIFGLGAYPVLMFQNWEQCQRQLDEMEAEREEHISQGIASPPLWGMQGSGYATLGDFAESDAFLPLGGWATNNEPKGFALPGLGVDGVIYNDGAGDRYFVDELRSAFRWGGFPVWQVVLRKPRFRFPGLYRPNFEKLLPILKEGLIEL